MKTKPAYWIKRINPEDLDWKMLPKMDWNIGVCSMKMQNLPG